MNWIIKKLEEAVYDKTGGSHKFQRKDYLNEGLFPIIEQGQSIVSGYTNNSELAYKGNIPVIIFGDHTRIIKYIDFKFAIGADGVKILEPLSFVTSKYLYYFLLKNEIPNSGYNRHFKYLKNLLIPIPPLSEQKKILEILEQADELRKKKKEVIEKSEKIITSLFYKMFGDPNETNEFIKLESLVEQIERRNPSARPEEEFKYVDIAGVDGIKGEIVNVKNILGNDAPGRARQVIKAKDVIVSTVRPYLRATALVPENLDNQICSTGFCVLRLKNKTGYGFIYALSRLEWFTQRLNDLARGASYPAVSDQDILTLDIPKPKKEFLDKFDKLIDNIIIVNHSYQESSQKLELMFESIQHNAFSGELTRTWREKNKEQLKAEIADRKLTYGF